MNASPSDQALPSRDRLLCGALPFLAFIPPVIERLRGIDSIDTLQLGLVVFAPIILPIAALGYWLVGRWRWLASLYLAVIVVGYVDVAFDGVTLLTKVAPFIDGLSQYPQMFVRFAAFAFVSGLLALSIRPRLQTVIRTACVGFGVIALSSVLVSERAGLTAFDHGEPSGATASAESLQQRVVILFDGMIGAGGLNDTMRDGPELRREIMEFFEKHGFRHYFNAFSEYSRTAAAVPSIMNGVVGAPERVNAFTTALSDGGYSLNQNAFFERMAEEGRTISVFQSPYIDYCRNKHVSRCDTLNSYDYFNGYVDPSVGIPMFVVGFVALKHTLQDSILFRYPMIAIYRIMKNNARRSLVPDGVRYSSISFIAYFNAFVRDIKSTDRRALHFAHFLVPHAPHILESGCGVIDRWPEKGPRDLTLEQGLRGDALERARADHYRRYLGQVRCAFKKLEDLMAALKKTGKLAHTEIVVLSDHGSRISSALMSYTLGPRDLVDNYSATFAIRRPGEPGGLVDAQISVQSLFKAFLLDRFFTEPYPVDQSVVYVREKGGEFRPAKLPRF